MKCKAVVASIPLVFLAACQSSPPEPVSLPALDHNVNANCFSEYPEELGSFPIAFAGTITKEQPGKLKEKEDPEKKMKPMEFTLRVDEAYAGELGKTIVLYSYDYMASTQNPSHVGERFLVATTESQDLVMCGYTRPYSDQDAEFWRYTFG